MNGPQIERQETVLTCGWWPVPFAGWWSEKTGPRIHGVAPRVSGRKTYASSPMRESVKLRRWVWPRSTSAVTRLN